MQNASRIRANFSQHDCEALVFFRGKRVFILALMIVAGVTPLPAHADVGPCKFDQKREIHICGEGNGAAIVFRDTLSPSERLGLAWRTPDAPPTEQPEDDKIELLILQLADGAVLARG